MINWGKKPGKGRLDLATAMQRADEFEQFVAGGGFDARVELYRVGDPPLHRFRYPRAYVVVRGTAQAPATVDGFWPGRTRLPRWGSRNR